MEHVFFLVFVVNTLESHSQNFKTIKHLCFWWCLAVNPLQHSTNPKNKKNQGNQISVPWGSPFWGLPKGFPGGKPSQSVTKKQTQRFLLRKTCLAANLSNPQVVCFQQSVKQDVFIQTSKLDQELTSQLKSSCRKLIHKLLHFCHFWKSMEITKDLHCKVGESIHLPSWTMKFRRQTL